MRTRVQSRFYQKLHPETWMACTRRRCRPGRRCIPASRASRDGGQRALAKVASRPTRDPCYWRRNDMSQLQAFIPDLEWDSKYASGRTWNRLMLISISRLLCFSDRLALWEIYIWKYTALGARISSQHELRTSRKRYRLTWECLKNTIRHDRQQKKRRLGK